MRTSNWIHLPRDQGENKKMFETTNEICLVLQLVFFPKKKNPPSLRHCIGRLSHNLLVAEAAGQPCLKSVGK